jgi:copper homeostasis protein
MNNLSLEVCVFSITDALLAQDAGADRVELCSAFNEGGLTPSPGTMVVIRGQLDIELYVMIRPRGGDFCYDVNEFKQMHIDIDFAKSFGAVGVVFGILKPDGHVDVERVTKLVNRAAPMKVTFHRAFDYTADPFAALEDIIKCGCTRILTSGQKPTAPEGYDLIKELVERADGRIRIMAGSGLTPENAKQFAEIGADVHFSAKKLIDSKMTYRNEYTPCMQTSIMPDYKLVKVDEEKIQQMVKCIK